MVEKKGTKSCKTHIVYFIISPSKKTLDFMSSSSITLRSVPIHKFNCS